MVVLLAALLTSYAVLGACATPPSGKSDVNLVAIVSDVADAHRAQLVGLLAEQSLLPEGFAYHSATTTEPEVDAYSEPASDAELVMTFPRISAFGYDPTTFGVIGETRDAQGKAWLHVRIPPLGLEPAANGTSAWVRAADVEITGHDAELRIDLSERTLALVDGGETVSEWTVGIGKPGSRTPTGEFFLWTKWLPEQGSHPAYGAGVLAVNAVSEDLPSWQGGAPLIGIHGSSRTSDLGAAISNGCVRMSNESLQQLLDTLPLGTRVAVVA